MSTDSQSGRLTETAPEPGIRLALEALARLRFGTIHLTVHDGRLVQVDVTERNRFNLPS